MSEIWSPLEIKALLNTAGIHDGFLAVPSSRNDSAWGAQLVRCIVLASGLPGPFLLVTSGVHGDEFEGPLGLSQALGDVSAIAPTRGCLVIVPIANPDAFRAGARHSPSHGSNLNRLFGTAERSLDNSSEVLHLALPDLLASFDALVDLHSGGSSLDFVPCAMWHAHPSLAGAAASRSLALGLGVGYASLISTAEADGTFDNFAARQGKIAVAVELGGGGLIRTENVRLARAVVLRAMTVLGIASEPEPSRPTTALDWPLLLRAPDDGIFECLCSLEDKVSRGQPLAILHTRVGRDDYKQIQEVSPRDGIVVAIRAITNTKSGDALVAISQLVDDMRE
ncbi:MAG: succinylglutamate desuccinylase/aspartoacylase family protein [Caulobacteraceae bacterium]|nr:succinylglutamate desuccinylase/aspartoacylase family protein [Caulobacteraceae bacterium]